MSNARRLTKGLCGLLPFGLILTCSSLQYAAGASAAQPDSLVAAILKAEVLESKPASNKEGRSATSRVDPEAVIKIVPLQTALAQGRLALERHGFVCWSGLSDGRGEYLQASAYQAKTQRAAEKVIVKCYYQAKRIVSIEVWVDHNVRPPARGFWSATGPAPGQAAPK
jgi:hypothetical protein